MSVRERETGEKCGVFPISCPATWLRIWSPIGSVPLRSMRLSVGEGLSKEKVGSESSESTSYYNGSSPTTKFGFQIQNKY